MQVVSKKCLNGQEVAKKSKKGGRIVNVILVVVSLIILAVFVAKVVSITIERNAAKLAAFEKGQNTEIQEELSLQEAIERHK